MPYDPIPTAETSYDALTDDVDFSLPDVTGIVMPVFPAVADSVFTVPPAVTIAELTEGKINGSGVFDALMTSVTAHIDRERAAGRITNNEFAKIYVEFSSAAMNTALQFLLQRDAAHWAAVTAQNQAKLVQVELAKAAVELHEVKERLKLTAYQAAAAKGQVALSKMQLAVATSEYSTSEYNLAEILPKQALNLTAQKSQIDAQTLAITNTMNTLLPEQVRQAKTQADNQEYQTLNVLPKQVEQMSEQIRLITEQLETQRAQTMDTRSDGVTPVTGTLGKQKELHAQQIVSYRRDAQLKAARPFIDAWITMKTIDEGTLPPIGFNNANLDEVLSVLRTDNELSAPVP